MKIPSLMAKSACLLAMALLCVPTVILVLDGWGWLVFDSQLSGIAWTTERGIVAGLLLVLGLAAGIAADILKDLFAL